MANLIKILRSAGVVHRRRKPPRQVQPKAISADYYKALKRVIVAPLHEIVGEFVALLKQEPLLTSARQDAGVPPHVRKSLTRAGEKMAASFERSKALLERLATEHATRTSRYQRAQLGKQVKALVGVDLPMADKAVSDLVPGFVSENVSLCRRMTEDLRSGIERETERVFREGGRWEELSDALEERVGVSESRAALIARDQIGKLYSDVNQARQRELGADKYIWRTMNDERVRPEHEVLEGEEFSWDDPPDGENPGEAVLCRCYAEPVFSELEQG
jgi:SPP1 gp7 family putative phage head morphogenesis protein